MKHYIDIDDTISNSKARAEKYLHVNTYKSRGHSQSRGWDAFFSTVGEDPLMAGASILDIALKEGRDIHFLTARPERSRMDTKAWLSKHFEHYNPQKHTLIMKPDNIYTPSHAWKVQEVALRETPESVFVFVDDQPLNRQAMKRDFPNAIVMAPEDAWPYLKSTSEGIPPLLVEEVDRGNEVYEGLTDVW